MDREVDRGLNLEVFLNTWASVGGEGTDTNWFAWLLQ